MDEITQKVVDGTAWTEFCGLLADAGRTILAEGNPDDPLDRAEGYRMLTRLLRGALEGTLEYGDPAHPVLVHACHETIKIVGENPDNHYLGATLDGKYDYRIRGTRGEAKWISFNLFSLGGFGSDGPGVGETLHEEHMHFEEDGTFDLIISPHEHPGNWLRSEPETRSLAIRQTFTDKKHGVLADLQIERIGDDGTPPDPLSPEHLYLSLIYAGLYVKGVADIGSQCVHRRGRTPRDRQVQGPADQVAPGLLRSRARRSARHRGDAARVRVLDVRAAQPLDGDARLHEASDHHQLPRGRARGRRPGADDRGA